LFAIAVAVLVTVSLATQPESTAKLRGLTFFTLGEHYRPSPGHARSIFTLQMVVTIVFALVTAGLWIHFA
jgi:hypothetical protein